MAGIASILTTFWATPLARRFGTPRTLIAAIVLSAGSFVGFYLIDNFLL